MSDSIRILHVEDIQSDADFVKRELEKAKLTFNLLWVSNKLNFQKALTEYNPSIILCDHSLPGFTSVEAFKMVRETGLKIPFILITATISEEFAVMMMKEGIADYLLKDRIQRLPVAITSALQKWNAEAKKEEYLEEIVRNEKRFRGLIENSNDVIALCDGNLVLKYTSPNLTRITGFTMQEIVQWGFASFIHAVDQPMVYDIIKQSAANPGEYFALTCRFRHKQDHYLYLDGSVVNLLHDESINGIILNVRDITGRKLTEASLQKSEANLIAIIENSDAHVYSLDSEFRYITFNNLLKNTLHQIYGLGIREGDKVFDFLKMLEPAEAKEWEGRYTEALSGQSVRFVKEFKIGDYHSFTSFSINPIRENNKITGLSCFARDVTPEKLADEKIKQSEARFRALIENNYDAITLRNEDLSIIYHSPSARRMMGYDEIDATDDSFYEKIHRDDTEKVQTLLQQAKGNPGKAYQLIVRAKHQKGHYIWVEGIVRNMLQNESVKGIIFNYRDITERKESELQREKMTADLIQRNKDLEQFTYIVSHNLRAPVANILGIANLIESDFINKQEGPALMNGISLSAQKLDEVITDLNHILMISREINENKQYVHFQNLIIDIQSSIRDVINKNQVKIITDFQVEGIETIKSYIYSIFYNLISNSIKFRQPEIPPTIEVRSVISDNQLTVTFKDNGIGINLETQGSKVFGLYKRFHPETEGKGMGLFMVKTQVQAIGGTISIESEVNKGTEFTILL